MMDGAHIVPLLWAIAAFTTCASAIYLIHDLMNLGDDRRLPMEQRRPLSAGTFPVPYTPPLVIGLLVVGFGVSLSVLPPSFTALLAIYFAVGCIYATRLGRIPVIETLLPPGMMTLRVWAGGGAVGVPVSGWALTACLLIFIFLGCIRRFSSFIRAA
jgi:decaprenyl-phosphate phosphoribosyltransferase